MEYPFLDRTKCKPFKCYQCTGKSACDHGFKTYRMPTVEDLDEYYGYGNNRDLNSVPNRNRMNCREGRRPLDTVFVRHQPNYKPGASNYEYVRPTSANGTTYYEYISYPGISSPQSMKNPQNWGRHHCSKPETSRPKSWKSPQRSMLGTSNSQSWRCRQGSVSGTSNSENLRYQQSSVPETSNSQNLRHQSSSEPETSNSKKLRHQPISEPETSNSQNLRRKSSSEPETLDLRGIIYTPNQSTIPRRYFPYDYYLSRELILKRIRNRNLN